MEENWDFQVLEIRRVVRMTAGGRRFKIRAIVIGGNRNGEVGIGIAKGIDIAQAVEKAKYQAQKNKIQVPIKNNTIVHESIGKVGAGRVLIKPAKQGKGIVAGGSVRLLFELAGVKNIVSKILGVTKNPLINVLAAFDALKKLRDLPPDLLKETAKVGENINKESSKNDSNSSD